MDNAQRGSLAWLQLGIAAGDDNKAAGCNGPLQVADQRRDLRAAMCVTAQVLMTHTSGAHPVRRPWWPAVAERRARRSHLACVQSTAQGFQSDRLHYVFADGNLTGLRPPRRSRGGS